MNNETKKGTKEMSHKIISLTSENVKRLKAIRIEPNGNTVVIGGKNGNGKTSVLDSIAMALGGGDEICARPVRSGAKRAEINLDLGDINIRRTFNPDGGTGLVVTSKDGGKFPSPQAMLDKMTGKVSFDPLSFQRLNKKAQADALRKMVGLDVSAIDRRRLAAFDERTAVNRNVKALKARVDGTERVDAPDKEVVIADVLKALADADANNREIRRLESEAVDAAAGLAAQKENIERIKQTLEAAEKRVVTIENDLKVLDAAIAGKKLINTAPMQAEIKTAEDTNRKVRAKLERKDLERQYDDARAKASDLDDAIQACDDEKAKAMAEAKFPIEGLSFDDDGVSFNGVPFEQCSGAEQLRISVAIGMALNPDIRVLLVRDGSLLDADSLRMVAEMADEKDCQVWIERVSETGEGCTVVIEDGEIKA